MLRYALPLALLLAVPAAAAVPAVSPASAPATAQSAPAYRTHFEGGDPIGDYYTAMALRFGIAIVQPNPTKAFIIKSFDLPDKFDDALAHGQAALAPQGLTLRQSVTGKMIVLRVMTTEQARVADLQESPVTSGLEIQKIDVSRPDRFVTHLLPVNPTANIDALKRLASQIKDVKADAAGSADTGLTLIISGPARGVQEAAEAILKVEKPANSKIIVKTMQLQNVNAEELAKSLNASAVAQSWTLKAVADRRTNSIIITGPEDQVLDSLLNVISMEGSRVRTLTEPATQPATAPAQ
jgi:hypothetical protein